MVAAGLSPAHALDEAVAGDHPRDLPFLFDEPHDFAHWPTATGATYRNVPSPMRERQPSILLLDAYEKSFNRSTSTNACVLASKLLACEASR